MKSQIAKILMDNKYKAKLSKIDKAIWIVDIPKATEELYKLRNKIIPIKEAFSNWCKETKRNGGVLVGSSIREFFEYYENLNKQDI